MKLLSQLFTALLFSRYAEESTKRVQDPLRARPFATSQRWFVSCFSDGARGRATESKTAHIPYRQEKGKKKKGSTPTKKRKGKEKYKQKRKLNEHCTYLYTQKKKKLFFSTALAKIKQNAEDEKKSLRKGTGSPCRPCKECSSPCLLFPLPEETENRLTKIAAAPPSLSLARKLA